MGIFGRKPEDERRYRNISSLTEPSAVASSDAATRFFDRVVPFPDLDDAEFIYVETVRELGRERRMDDFAATEALGATWTAPRSRVDG
jgi:hypothetical protein